MSEENQFLLRSILFGINMTFLYDIVLICRRVLAHRKFFESIEDLGFWIYVTIQGFWLMYKQCEGGLRWFAILGALVGIICYKKIVSPFLIKIGVAVISRILCFLKKKLTCFFKLLKMFL